MTNQRRFVWRISALALAVAAALQLVAVTHAAPPTPPREPAPTAGGDSKVIPDQYIVVFNVGRSPRFDRDAREAIDIARRQSLAAQELVRRLGGVVLRQYNFALIGFSAQLPPRALEAVRAAPGVAYIEPDRLVVVGDAVQIQTLDPTDTELGLDRTDRRLPQDLDKKYRFSETGNNVNVYVLDSGIRVGHSEFEGRASGLVNFAPNASGNVVSTETDDCNAGSRAGHGTGVAAIIGGKTYGVAKKAKLHAVRMMDCNGNNTISNINAAIDYVAQNRVLPAVANMSSSYARTQSTDDSVSNAISAYGVPFVLSAGNDDGDACLKSPANVQDAITVGALNPSDDTRLGTTSSTSALGVKSNFGACVDLFAPGYRIPSADAVAGDNLAWARWSGTSFAAPHVAGVAARYLENNTQAPSVVWAAILNAANVKGLSGVTDTPNWNGVVNPGTGSRNVMLHWGALSNGTDDGEPHITTVDGIRYDLQSVGEFVVLRDGSGFEIQSRQAAVATAAPLTDPYTGLANCVSVNTAVAARIGQHRVTFQPDLSGVPNPSGLRLRVNGQVAAIGPNGLYLGGGRIAGTPGGSLDVTFPDGSELLVTPGIWNNTWYLNLSVLRTPALEGIVGAAPAGSWLPALPNGASMGPMPASLQQRHVDLNEKFADAWRVSDASSLFDYAPGASTATFTERNWPPKDGRCDVRGARPQRPIPAIVAQRLCGRIVDKGRRENCVFDVTVTGEATFAKTYALTERVLNSSTRVALNRDKDWTRIGEPVTFTAVVELRSGETRRAGLGSVQFVVDGRPATEPIALDRSGRASWRIARLRPGVSKVTARFIPGGYSRLLASSSLEVAHSVRRE